MPHDYETPVLIIGGGPVGFALALDLAWRGKRSIVAERDSATAEVMLAKANGLDERTMEHFRRWGLHERLVAVGFPQEYPGDTVYCTSLTGKYIGRSLLPSIATEPLPQGSSETRNTCPQYELDKLLCNAVSERGLTEVIYNATFDQIDQDQSGVTTTLVDTRSGKNIRVRSDYVVGCDGAGSAVRKALGIPFEGPQLDFSLSIMLRIPRFELPYNIANGQRYLLIDENGTWGILTFIDGREIWRLTMVGSQEKLDSDAHDDRGAVIRALGTDQIPFEIVRRIPWRRSQCVAARYRSGRVLLAGDSAHTTSPTGGHGLNTGLGDVSDLSWMLAGTLEGWAGPRLLDAYEKERRPVGIRNGRKSTENYKDWVDNSGYKGVLDPGEAGDNRRFEIGKMLIKSLHSEWYSTGIALGFRYENSPAIIPDGTPPPPDDPVEYLPTTRPGHRAPHFTLADGRSVLTLFGKEFVLLRMAATEIDVARFEGAALQSEMPLRVVDITEKEGVELYERRLVLVRPDGHVAWRGDVAPADAQNVVDVLTGRSA
jgi:2-polyprenyl-6-methoxyphenol hydroxylase-like FAD-dependent oxidoreductase